MSNKWKVIYTILIIGAVWTLFQPPKIEQSIFMLGALIFMTLTNFIAMEEKKARGQPEPLFDKIMFLMGFIAIIFFGYLLGVKSRSLGSTIAYWMVGTILLKEIMIATCQKFWWHHILGAVLIGQTLWEWAYSVHIITTSPFWNIFYER